jgi:hypothetical protein
MKYIFLVATILFFTNHIRAQQFFNQQPQYIQAVSQGSFVNGYNNGMNFVNPAGAQQRLSLGERDQSAECLVLRGDNTVLRNINGVPALNNPSGTHSNY